jgi:hypothetical protein
VIKINTTMLKTVSEEVKLYRMSICNDCNNFNKTMKTCKQCGCYMPAKAMFASSTCPDDKWTTSEPGQNLINKIEEMILESWNK